MSAFAGILRRDGAPVGSDEVARMLDALDHWGADRRGAWTEGSVGMGHLLLEVSPEQAYERLPIHDAASGLSLTGIFRLDDREALGGELGFDAADLPTIPDGRLVLAAYRRWGEDTPRHLLGDFAFAVHDSRRGTLFCCRDPFGVKPFYYAEAPGTFAFASEMKGLLALPYVEREVNETWVVDHVCRILLERDQTFWESIRRLEPAHCMVVTADRIEIRRHWTPDLERELRLGNEDEYVEAFRDALGRAIRRRVGGSFPVGAELSGGLDSCGIIALAEPMLRERGMGLRTYAQVGPEQDPGEPLPEDGRADIRALVEFAGLDLPHLLTGEDDDCLDTVAWAETIHDEPPRLAISLLNDRLYEAARADGVRVLLSGFGGNQCVSAEGGQVGRELLRMGRFAELWRVTRPTRPGRSRARALAQTLSFEAVTDVVRGLRRGSFKEAAEQKLPFRGLRAEMAERHDLPDRFRRYQESYPRRDTVRSAAAARLDAPAVALRLEYSHVATLSRRLEYRFPLLDRDLVEFFIAVPSVVKWRGGIGRWLFRRSIEGFVPDQIAWSNRRASANPGSVLRLRRAAPHLVERLRSLPSDSRVFDFVDPDVLLAQPRIRRGPRGKHAWERTSDLIRVLLLDQKLRLTEKRR